MQKDKTLVAIVAISNFSPYASGKDSNTNILEYKRNSLDFKEFCKTNGITVIGFQNYGVSPKRYAAIVFIGDNPPTEYNGKKIEWVATQSYPNSYNDVRDIVYQW